MTITRLIGIYNADGGIVGEVKYIVGHLLGTAECALCDITHSPIRRKPEWDRMVAGLGIPMTVLHRNELSPDIEARIQHFALPCVVAERVSGEVVEIVSKEALTGCEGSVSAFAEVLRERLQTS
jgi:hypothetical protein